MTQYIRYDENKNITNVAFPDLLPEHIVGYIFDSNFDSPRYLKDFVIREVYEKNSKKRSEEEIDKLETTLLLSSKVDVLKEFLNKSYLNDEQAEEFKYFYNSILKDCKKLDIATENLTNNILVEFCFRKIWNKPNPIVEDLVVSNVQVNSKLNNTRKSSNSWPLLIVATYKDLDLLDKLLSKAILSDDQKLLTGIKSLEKSPLLDKDVELFRVEQLYDHYYSKDKNKTDGLLKKETLLYTLFFEYSSHLKEKASVDEIKKFVINHEKIGLTDKQEEAILYLAIKKENYHDIILSDFKKWNFAAGSGLALKGLLEESKIITLWNKNKSEYEVLEGSAVKLLFKNKSNVEELYKKKKLNVTEEWARNLDTNPEIEESKEVAFLEKLLELYLKIEDTFDKGVNLKARKIVSEKIETNLQAMSKNINGAKEEKRYLDISMSLTSKLESFKQGNELREGFVNKGKNRI